jgi:hypothetical protein
MDIILIYKTDNWHSYGSRDLIGVASSMRSTLRIIKLHAKKEFQKLSEDDLFNLQNIKQTQGYEGDGEFDYEIVETNKML